MDNHHDDQLNQNPSIIQLQHTIIQLQQQLLDYKPEFNHKNNLYNEQTLPDEMNNDTKEGKREIEEHHNETESKISATAYFNYSVFLPDQEETESETLVVGHFHVVNTGNQVLTNPIIGFRITPVNGANISGKITTEKNTESVLYTSEEEWRYMHSDWKEKIRKQGEYWLKPVHCPQLQPGEILSFSSFNIRMPPTDSQVKIEGFCFSTELSEGVPAMNRISIHF